MAALLASVKSGFGLTVVLIEHRMDIVMELAPRIYITLREVSVEVQEAEIVAIIGANGARKSTLLCTIAGLVRPRRGRILFRDRNQPDAAQPRGCPRDRTRP